MKLTTWIESLENVSELTPVLIIDWDLDAVHAFVEQANCLAFAPLPMRSRLSVETAPRQSALGGCGSEPPVALIWLHTLPPLMASDSFTNDMVAFAAADASGRHGRVALASNMLRQVVGVMWRLCAVEADPFVQAATTYDRSSSDSALGSDPTET